MRDARPWSLRRLLLCLVLVLLVVLPLLALALAGVCFRRLEPEPCNALRNDAPAVPCIAMPGAPPAFTGGALEDGVYTAMSAEAYGGAAPSGRHMTLAVRHGGTELDWTGDLLNATGTQVTLSLNANATVAVSGNRLRLTTTCSSISPPPLPDAMAFSASPGRLVLAFVDGATASVTTYARRPGP